MLDFVSWLLLNDTITPKTFTARSFLLLIEFLNNPFLNNPEPKWISISKKLQENHLQPTQSQSSKIDSSVLNFNLPHLEFSSRP